MVAALATPMGSATTAHAAAPMVACPPAAEWQMRDLLNNYRAANGRSALAMSAELTAKAQAWSDYMASIGRLQHSSLSSGVSPGWGAIAENIAVNYSVAAAQTALQNSSSHRTNMLGGYTEMGLGVSMGVNGTIWVTQVFVARSTPTAAYQGPNGAAAYAATSPTVVFNPGSVPGGTTSTFAVAGVGGVPSGATAAVVTIEGWNAADRGWVQALAPGAAVGSSSNLNVVTGGAANTAVVPLAPDGSMRLYNSAEMTLKVTVSGYFEPTDGPTRAGRFMPLTPSRLLDTRPQYVVGYSGAKPDAGDTVTVQVSGRGGVPTSGIRAVALNVVAVQPEGPGDVQVGAPGMSAGGWRNLIVSRPSQVVANLVIVPVDSNGRVALRTTVGTHLVVDVQGWFTTTSAPSTMAGLLVPMAAARAIDTRGGTAVAAPVHVDVTSRFDLPKCAQAMLLNLTAIPVLDTTTYLQVGPYHQFLGGTFSHVNADTVGAPVANAAMVRTGDGFDVELWAPRSTHAIVDVSGWFI
ncbi:MAG TPA: hypothetical protein DCR14_02760 [Acidimicrobiaceae bacterium]|nr:hypothetical protein [Acidimicrobiaceae bacterium]